MATPKDVLDLARKAEAQIVDFRFCDLPARRSASPSPSTSSPRRGSRPATASTAPRSAASRRSRSPTCSGPGPRGLVHRPVPVPSHAGGALLRARSDHGEMYAGPRYHPQGRAVPGADRDRRDLLLGRSASSTSSTRSGSTRTSTRATTTSTRWRARGTRGPRRAERTSATSPGTRRYFPLPPWTTTRTFGRRWSSTSRRWGSTSRCTTTRWAPPARRRSTSATTRC